MICYQCKADRTLRGIDEQVARAEQAVAGKTLVKRNRFIRPSGGDRDRRERHVEHDGDGELPSRQIKQAQRFLPYALVSGIEARARLGEPA